MISIDQREIMWDIFKHNELPKRYPKNTRRSGSPKLLDYGFDKDISDVINRRILEETLDNDYDNIDIKKVEYVINQLI